MQYNYKLYFAKQCFICGMAIPLKHEHFISNDYYIQLNRFHSLPFDFHTYMREK